MSKRPPTKRTRFLSTESRRIICKTFHFLKEELEFMRQANHDSCDLSPLSSVAKRVCEATGISKRTLTRYLTEERTGSVSSNKKRKQKQRRRLKAPFLEMTSRIANAIRSTMHGIIQDCMQRDNEKTPTCDELITIFQETINFEGPASLLKEILISMGYRWLLDDDKKIIIEKHDFKIRRYRFLKDIMKYREKKMTIVYTGARVVYRDEVKGSCYTVFCAGTENGCLPKTVWISYSGYATIDLEYNVNYKLYNSWLTKYLLPNLPINSVVVVNDVHFNRKQCFIPTGKEELKKWLRNHNILFEEDLHRIELLDIVKKNKDKFAAYATDELICQYGLIVLRLPPKHPELNAVEVIFERIKTDVKHAQEHSTFDSNLDMINSVIEKVEPSVWNEFCEIVKRVEFEYFAHYDDAEETIQIHDEDDEQISSDDSSDCSDSDE